MKKIFLLLVLAFAFTTSYAQETNKTNSIQDTKELVKDVKPTVTEAERIIDKYGGKAIEGFNNAVEKITPMAEQGFKMAVKLQIAKGIVNILPLLALIISIILFRKEYTRIDNLLMGDNTPSNYNEHRGVFDEDNVTPFILLTLFFILISAILTTICTYDGITHLVAPEWYAIKEIIQLVK